MKTFKLTRFQTILLGIVIPIIVAFLVLLFNNVAIFGDVRVSSKEVSLGVFHVFFNIILYVAAALLLILSSIEWSEEKATPLSYFYTTKRYKYGSDEAVEGIPISVKILKRLRNWGIIIVLLFVLGSFFSDFYNQGKLIYNTSKKYHNTYEQKTLEKVGFYDKMWKTYYSKDKITNINRETFIQVTKIIMENRADGQSITWKWVQENQQIPYEEFTKFYADLSSFIEAQREDYFGLEKACQNLANQHNTLLDTFPNNIYNKILKCERIKFEYGFTSDQTEEVFRSKQENPQ